MVDRSMLILLLNTKVFSNELHVHAVLFIDNDNKRDLTTIRTHDTCVFHDDIESMINSNTSTTKNRTNE
jgi:hypothetical protein